MTPAAPATKRSALAVRQGAFDFAALGQAETTRRPLDGRFADVSERKATGSTYTPSDVASYLAAQLVDAAVQVVDGRELSILDPAIGDGALALALLQVVLDRGATRVRLVGYETNPTAAAVARTAITTRFRSVELELRESDFLAERGKDTFDLAIANPPYVRTQILGAEDAGQIVSRYGLAGRVDLYQAFALEIIDRLKPGAALGLITSNRFLTTKGSAAFRDAINASLDIARLWDLGDTKVFDAAVLPAMLVGRKARCRERESNDTRFTSIYENRGGKGKQVDSLSEALDDDGEVQFADRAFKVVQGHLRVRSGEVWRVSSNELDDWLRMIEVKTWRRLGEVGKIRVGIKTTADKVFIRNDWKRMGDAAPELLRPLITHHVAGRYRGTEPSKQVLYPHLERKGRREVAELSRFPKSAAYLEMHRESLEARKYVIAAGRKWYEVWVPQDPTLWVRPKIVFRDISETPTFWIDESGSVVNGDCYWLVPDDPADADVLWLALAVTNSTFVEAFYDRCFNNKLYAGRRRFMTQYVEKFPLPQPSNEIGQQLVAMAKSRYACDEPAEQVLMEQALDALVWKSFGLSR